MNKVTPIDEEYEFDREGVLVSQTDLEGVITYVNKKFRDITGYSHEELVGQKHSIIRHPDMPKSAFSKLWDTISHGQVYNGTIKNMRKDGKYFWVNLEILPIRDENEATTTYIAVARPASQKDREENEELYIRMLESEQSKGDE